jgi:hypothetical protein
MENPWFGRKGNGYTGGPVTWQGWVVTILGLGGAIACHTFLGKPVNDWVGGALLVAFGLTWWLTYDPDTESY